MAMLQMPRQRDELYELAHTLDKSRRRGPELNRMSSSQRRPSFYAHHDPLTGLPNRLLFGARLEHALARNANQTSRVAVIVLDLDRFKNVNDSTGHAAGDQLLRAAAQRLRELIGPGDTLSRLSGDEFAILLEPAGAMEVFAGTKL